MAKTELVPGTLILLVLRVLQSGPLHGYAIAQRISQLSSDVLRVEEGSLYPALQRLLLNECVEAHWDVTENNRRARYYKITPRGRKHLESEKKNFDFLLAGIARVMEA